MARQGFTPFVHGPCAPKDWERDMVGTRGLGVEIIPACDSAGQPMDKDVSRDFEAITRRVQIHRTAYPAMDMMAHEDLLVTVVYLVLYL